MKIAEIIATNLTIPYEVPYRPAWQPGVVRNSRDFTLVRIRSDEGLTGYAGCDGHHAGNIRANVAPYMLGQAVWLTEEFARVFRNAGGTWFIDQALWDLIGKRAGVPLYQMWGAARDKVMAYASTSELGTPTDRATLAARYRAEGFRAMKLRFHCETIEEDLALLDAAMEAARDASFMVDANQATFLPAARRSPLWDFKRALATARALDERGVLWLEEPLGKFDFDNLARLRAQTDIDIAGGESNRELHEFRWLIERGVYDIIQPDCCLSEGISQLRKVAALAEAHNIHFIPHHGLSALGLAATLHLACCTPGLAWLELMYEPPTRTIETYQQLGGIVTSKIWIDDDGFVSPPDDPGLGVRVDEEAIGTYAV